MKGTANVMREHKFLRGNRKTCVSTNLDEAICLQFDKRKESISEMKERDYKGLQRAHVAHLV